MTNSPRKECPEKSDKFSENSESDFLEDLKECCYEIVAQFSDLWLTPLTGVSE